MIKYQMLKLKGQKLERGFAAFYITVLILAIVLAISTTIQMVTYGEQKISQNIIKSSQANYIAEAGIEDSVYRIIKGKKYEATNNLNVGEGIAKMSITSEENRKIIKSTGELSQRVKTSEVILNIESSIIAFYYGAQIDKGGLWLGANASVEGNVYSNGKIDGQGKGSGSKVSGDAWVAVSYTHLTLPTKRIV